MRALAWSQLAHRRSRALALLCGIVIATAAFSVLTGAATTSRLQARGAVAEHFRTAYDVLVRPAGARTGPEREQGLVRPGVLSGIYGGIRLEQWQSVLGTPGVEAAAPIAVVGYTLPDVNFPIDLTRDGPGLFRVRVTRVTDRGLTRRRDVSTYVWVTGRRLLRERGSGNIADPLNYAPRLASSAGPRPVCASDYQRLAPEGPFDRGPEGAGRGGAFGNLQCWSRISGLDGTGFQRLGRGRVAALIPDPLPFVIAAVDPEQEAKLAGLDRGVTSGRYLRADDRPTRESVPRVPVLLSTRAFADETLEATVERLPAAATRAIGVGGRTGNALRRWLERRPGVAIRRLRVTPRDTLGALGAGGVVPSYWAVGATEYDMRADGTLVPRTRDNPPEAWLGPGAGGYVTAPLSADDRGFRTLRAHRGIGAAQVGQVFAGLHVVGRFDPRRLPGFADAVSEPLQTYRTPALAAADQRTDDLLGGRALLPNGNIAGYLTQPPLMLTNLASLSRFTAPHYDPPLAAAPISAIRVRVAGVHGIDDVSRERVRRAAEAIQRRTGLDVDLTIGSSPSPKTIALPAGRHGRPALTLSEPWVRKGVGLAILSAVDRKSLVLFALILVVCTLFVANATAAAVRSRRTELGVLVALGWTTPRLFGAVLWELGTIGACAGLLGAALAIPLSAAVGVTVDPVRCAVTVPAAIVLTLAAGAVPAWRAARAQPVDTLRPAVHVEREGRRPRGVAGLAAVNLRRVRGRTLMGALSLGVGVCALTLLLATTLAFRGVLVGSLLGDLVSVRVRAVDYVAVVTTVALGALSVADVLYLNLRERAGEMATLHATGWAGADLGRLVAFEGMGIGIVGALPGAAAGLAGAAALAGGIPPAQAGAAAIAALTGTIVATAASLVPVALLAREPVAAALGEE